MEVAYGVKMLYKINGNKSTVQANEDGIKRLQLEKISQRFSLPTRFIPKDLQNFIVNSWKINLIMSLRS